MFYISKWLKKLIMYCQCKRYKSNILQQNFTGFFVVGCSCFASVGLSMWFLCLSYEERNAILQIIKGKMNLRKG